MIIDVIIATKNSANVSTMMEIGVEKQHELWRMVWIKGVEKCGDECRDIHTFSTHFSPHQLHTKCGDWTPFTSHSFVSTVEGAVSARSAEGVRSVSMIGSAGGARSATVRLGSFTAVTIEV